MVIRISISIIVIGFILFLVGCFIPEFFAGFNVGFVIMVLGLGALLASLIFSQV